MALFWHGFGALRAFLLGAASHAAERIAHGLLGEVAGGEDGGGAEEGGVVVAFGFPEVAGCGLGGWVEDDVGVAVDPEGVGEEKFGEGLEQVVGYAGAELADFQRAHGQLLTGDLQLLVLLAQIAYVHGFGVEGQYVAFAAGGKCGGKGYGVVGVIVVPAADHYVGVAAAVGGVAALV